MNKMDLTENENVVKKARHRKDKKDKKTKQALELALESPDVTPEVSQTPFIRALGSTDFITRAKGVQALTRFLQLKTDLSEADLLKIWKGLYVCFWHSDKASVQEDLADRLVGIFPMLNQSMAYLYFTVFMHTMRREWFSIDRLRLDKFLMLVRKFMGQLFVYLRSHNWDAALLEQYADFLRDHLLLPQDSNHAIGLAYHVCDLFVPELRGALAAGPGRIMHQNQQQQQKLMEAAAGKKRGRQLMQQQQQEEAAQAGGLPADAFEALLEPFSTTLLRATEQAMLTRVRESVFDPLVEELQEEGADSDGEGEEEDENHKQWQVPLLILAGGEALCASFASQLFEMGSMPEVKARNRVVLFGISQSLEKAQRKRAKRMLSNAAPSSPSAAPAILSLPRHLHLQQQQQQQEQQRRQQEQTQQQKQQQNGAGSSKKAKKDKSLVFVTDGPSTPNQQEHQQQKANPSPVQPSQPSDLPFSAPASLSPKSLKKQRKAEAAAAAAAAWGEGGIGSKSKEGSPSSIPPTLPASSVQENKHSKKGQKLMQEAEVSVSPATAASEEFGNPAVTPGSTGKKKSKKKVDDSGSVDAAGAGAEFMFSSAAGPSGQGGDMDSSTSTPTLGKSATKKDKKRKAEGDGGSPWAGVDGEDGLVELASVSKSALRLGAKRRASMLAGEGAGLDEEGQQPSAPKSDRKKQRRQQQNAGEGAALGSPQPPAPQSALKSALKQQQQQADASNGGTPVLRSALKHKPTGGAASKSDLEQASKEALKSAVRHKSAAATDASDVDLKSASKSALKAAAARKPDLAARIGATPGAPPANALQAHLSQEVHAPAPHAHAITPGGSKRASMQQQQQGLGSNNAAHTPQGEGTAAGSGQKSSSAKKKAAAAAGGPNTSVHKAVRINLRNNLYFEHGGPIPDPMTRTPPTARSKGGILKRAQESLAAMGIASTPQSAPAKLQKQQQLQAAAASKASGKKPLAKSTNATPIKSPRARAELFF